MSAVTILDGVYLVVIVAFFALMLGYVHACLCLGRDAADADRSTDEVRS